MAWQASGEEGRRADRRYSLIVTGRKEALSIKNYLPSAFTGAAMARCYQRRWTAAIISWERGARLREDGRWKSRKIAETGYRKADIGKKWNRRKQKQRRFGLILVVLVTFCENSLETEEI